MKILVADDHTLLADMLEAHLARLAPDVAVAKAARTDEALRVIQSDPDFDLILLDLYMPGMERLAGLRSIQQACPNVPIVIMSGAASNEDIDNAIVAGAAGFIPKTMGGRAMLKALELVLSGETFVPAGGVKGNSALSPDQQQENARPLADAQLSEREAEVLRLLTQGMSNKEIARALDLQVVTVALHLGRIYKKLGVRSRTQAVKLAIERGWPR